jgi:hypothetical protein
MSEDDLSKPAWIAAYLAFLLSVRLVEISLFSVYSTVQYKLAISVLDCAVRDMVQHSLIGLGSVYSNHPQGQTLLLETFLSPAWQILQTQG